MAHASLIDNQAEISRTCDGLHRESPNRGHHPCVLDAPMRLESAASSSLVCKVVAEVRPRPICSSIQSQVAPASPTPLPEAEKRPWCRRVGQLSDGPFHITFRFPHGPWRLNVAARSSSISSRRSCCLQRSKADAAARRHHRREELRSSSKTQPCQEHEQSLHVPRRPTSWWLRIRALMAEASSCRSRLNG